MQCLIIDCKIMNSREKKQIILFHIFHKRNKCLNISTLLAPYLTDGIVEFGSTTFGVEQFFV